MKNVFLSFIRMSLKAGNKDSVGLTFYKFANGKNRIDVLMHGYRMSRIYALSKYLLVGC